jgi:hypothetical protein
MERNRNNYYHIRTFTLLIFVAAMMLLTTGCAFCDVCPHGAGNVMRESNAKKHQEALAKKENASSNQKGVFLSFTEVKIENGQQALVNIPAGGYKDLSIHYNLPEDKQCPFGLESIHSYFSAGPTLNFKSAGSDVYPGGSHKPGVGFYAGFRTNYRFSDKWSVIPGILYKQNNASEEGTLYDGEPGGGDPGISIVDKYSYNYLSVPILAQYSLTDNLKVSAGPEVNYLLKSKVKSTTSYGGDSHESKTDLTKNSVKLGVGVQVGLKYQIPDSRWALELNYDHRLSRLNKKEGTYGESPAWRMKSLQLGVKARICDLIKGPKHENVN